MSSRSPLLDVWDPAPEKSKSTTLYDHLAQHGFLAYRPLDDDPRGLQYDDLRPRNQDRVRILKRLSTSPGGLALKTIVSECVKGQPVGQCKRIDGSDPDYQFTYDYLTDLTEHVPPGFDDPVVREYTENGFNFYAPVPSLIDLILEGTATMKQTSEEHRDRAFARDVLRTSQKLTADQKDHLKHALESYVNRIDDYALLFDVTTYNGHGHGSKTDTFTKKYKTRFNDHGRIAKDYALFNDALEYNLEHAENAVLVTLTTDPGTTDDASRPNPRSILETTGTINPNFNRLCNWLQSDPSKADDTRDLHVPQWTPGRDPGNYNYFPDGTPTGGAPDGPVTGRPRKKLDYIKVLEFAEKGYPHLHVLFFDVPTREKDGMPWLVDKQELSHRWRGYDQGQIVDTYPLVKRDLDDLDAEFAGDADQGFVSWYEHGDHNRDDRWIKTQKENHPRIDFDSGQKEATAGAYLGKYLSVVLGTLMDTTSSIPTPEDTHQDKAAKWKLALYWATQTRFFSMSRNTREQITPNENLRDDAEAAAAVRWATKETVSHIAEKECLELAARRSTSLDEMENAADSAARAAITPNVESTLPESTDAGVVVNYRGAYRKWDLPTDELTAPVLDDTTDQFAQAQNTPPEPQADRPPPVATVWHE
jgi:hypothetical protein